MLISSKSYLNNILNIFESNNQKKKSIKQIFINIIYIILLLNQVINNWTSLSVICFGVCELTIRRQFKNYF